MTPAGEIPGQVRDPTETSDRRFLLDANVLLNEAFVASSNSRQCVETLLSDGHSSVLIDETIYQESVQNVLSKHAMAMGLPDVHALSDALDRYLAQNSIINVPPGLLSNVGTRHDAHVKRAASTYNCTLITNDITLVADCYDEGVSAVFPEELVKNEPTTRGSSPF